MVWWCQTNTMVINKSFIAIIAIIVISLFSLAIADTYFFSPANHNNLSIYNVSNITSEFYCNATSCLTLSELSIDIDSNLSEDDVEAYIFDSDNTANLGMNGYNVTGVDCVVFESGGSWCSS